MSTYQPRDNLLQASRGFTVFSSGSQVSMTTWSRFCTKNRDITEFISVFIWCWLISFLMPVALQASCQINLVLQVEEASLAHQQHILQLCEIPCLKNAWKTTTSSFNKLESHRHILWICQLHPVSRLQLFPFCETKEKTKLRNRKCPLIIRETYSQPNSFLYVFWTVNLNHF